MDWYTSSFKFLHHLRKDDESYAYRTMLLFDTLRIGEYAVASVTSYHEMFLLYILFFRYSKYIQNP